MMKLTLALFLSSAAICSVGAQNDPCYICNDGGVSTITKPDFVFQVPNEFQGEIPLAELTCGQILDFAEVGLLVPNDRCAELQAVEQIRIDCGCENTLVPETDVPIAGPVGEAPTDSPVVSIVEPEDEPEELAGTEAPSPSPAFSPVAVPPPTSTDETTPNTTLNEGSDDKKGGSGKDKSSKSQEKSSKEGSKSTRAKGSAASNASGTSKIGKSSKLGKRYLR